MVMDIIYAMEGNDKSGKAFDDTNNSFSFKLDGILQNPQKPQQRYLSVRQQRQVITHDHPNRCTFSNHQHHQQMPQSMVINEEWKKFSQPQRFGNIASRPQTNGGVKRSQQQQQQRQQNVKINQDKMVNNGHENDNGNVAESDKENQANSTISSHHHHENQRHYVPNTYSNYIANTANYFDEIVDSNFAKNFVNKNTSIFSGGGSGSGLATKSSNNNNPTSFRNTTNKAPPTTNTASAGSGSGSGSASTALSTSNNNRSQTESINSSSSSRSNSLCQPPSQQVFVASHTPSQMETVINGGNIWISESISKDLLSRTSTSFETHMEMFAYLKYSTEMQICDKYVIFIKRFPQNIAIINYDIVEAKELQNMYGVAVVKDNAKRYQWKLKSVITGDLIQEYYDIHSLPKSSRSEEFKREIEDGIHIMEDDVNNIKINYCNLAQHCKTIKEKREKLSIEKDQFKQELKLS